MRVLFCILASLFIGCGEGPLGGPESVKIKMIKGDPGDDGFPGKDGSPGADGQPGSEGSNGSDGSNGQDGPAGGQGTRGIPGSSGFVRETETQLVFRNEDGSEHPWVKTPNKIITMCRCLHGKMQKDTGLENTMHTKYWNHADIWFIAHDGNCWNTWNRMMEDGPSEPTGAVYVKRGEG